MNTHIDTLKKEGSVIWGQFVSKPKSGKHRHYFSKDNVDKINASNNKKFLFLLSDSDFNAHSDYGLSAKIIKNELSFLKTTELFKCTIERIILAEDDEGQLYELEEDLEQYIPEYYNSSTNNYRLFYKDACFQFKVGVWFLITEIEEISLSYLNHIRKIGTDSAAVSEIESYSKRPTKRYVHIDPIKPLPNTNVHKYALNDGILYPSLTAIDKPNVHIQFNEDLLTFQAITNKMLACDEAYFKIITNKFDYHVPQNTRESNKLCDIKKEVETFVNDYTMYDYSVVIYDEMDSNNEEYGTNTQNWLEFVEFLKNKSNKGEDRNECVTPIVDFFETQFSSTIISEAKYKKLDDSDKSNFVYGQLSSVYGSHMDVKCYIKIGSSEEVIKE